MNATEPLARPRPVLAVGETVVMAQDFNATCGVIEQIDDAQGMAVLGSAHDIFGSKGRVRAPLWALKPFGEAPRRLRVSDLVGL
jgi:hypothetical protein